MTNIAARMDQLMTELANWRRCPDCYGAGRYAVEAFEGYTFEQPCTCGTGRVECMPPDPAEYRPDDDITGEDRTELVEELYVLRAAARRNQV